LAGLLQHGHAGLHQHVLLGHLGRLGSEVGVHDAAHGGVGVVRHVGEVVDGVVQAVDVGTHLATCFTDGGEQGVESGDFALSSALVSQVGKSRSIDSTNFGRYVNVHGLGVRGADLQGDRSRFQSTTGCEQGIARAIAGVGDDVVQL